MKLNITMTKITQNLVKNLFNYKDGFLFWKNNRGSNKVKGNKAGTLDKNTGYYHIQINRKNYKNHRLIFLYYHNYLPKYIDHIDRNKQNNKIENLREITLSENQWNRKSNINYDNKPTSSKFKGVGWHKASQKWRAYITINGKYKNLGLFINESDAAKAYNETALKYFSKFACLNIIKEE